VAVGQAGWPGPEHWLLLRRSMTKPTEQVYFFSNAPPETPLRTVGLDHYKVRRYDGWDRHITLSRLAHTFLAELRRGEWGGNEHRSADLIPAERARNAASVGPRPAPAISAARSPSGMVRLATTASSPCPPLPASAAVPQVQPRRSTDKSCARR
jgi:hypothetical protein